MSQVQELRELPIDAVLPNPAQPRRHFDEEALKALADSMSERGVLQPVLVRPLSEGSYQLVAGERRWRAAQLAGLQSIPALVSRYDDRATLEVGLIENMARKDLNPVEEARACVTLMEEFGLSHRQIGIRVGRHMTVVSNLIRLLGLSGEILELLERGELSSGHGRALLTAKDLDARAQLARAAVQEGWTVRALENRARASNMDVAHSRQSLKGERLDPEQEQDMVALNVAMVWGDALGAEVHVRALPRRTWRVEIVFDSPEGALALGGRIGEAVARASRKGSSGRQDLSG